MELNENLYKSLKDAFTIRAIAAIADNNVIGKNNKIPWNIPDDLKFFQKTTNNSTVLMGRNTFNSIGHPLSNRQNIVISNSINSVDGVATIHTLDDLLRFENIKDLWVIGGASVYAMMLPFCQELYLSRILGNYDGDTFFPDFGATFKFDSVLAKFDKVVVEKWTNAKYK